MGTALRRLSFTAVPCLILAFAACGDDATTTGSSSASSSSAGGVGGTSAGGSGGSDGIGQPSDQYPAPHGAPPTVVDAGGHVLAAPSVVPIFFAGDDPSIEGDVTELLGGVAASSYWSATTSEYGVGALTANANVLLGEDAAPMLTPGDVETWLAAKLDANDPAFQAPTPGSIYAIFYPAGVTIASGSIVSCTGFGGYHSSIELDAAHGSKSVAYAVIPRCDTFADLDLLDALTVTTTHELIEASTDPYPTTAPAYLDVDDAHHAFTEVYGGGEVSDMCNLPDAQAVTLPGSSFLVQRSWSNAAALAGHDPCLPTMPGMTYFNAVPDAPDDIKLTGGITGKGIRIAAGDTRTVDVHLFSEGPTAPFQVFPEDYSEITGGTKQLALSFDEDKGQNGQTLHLTIHVVGSKKEQLFRLSSYDGHQWTYWIGAVGR